MEVRFTFTLLCDAFYMKIIQGAVWPRSSILYGNKDQKCFENGEHEEFRFNKSALLHMFDTTITRVVDGSLTLNKRIGGCHKHAKSMTNPSIGSYVFCALCKWQAVPYSKSILDHGDRQMVNLIT